MLPLSENRRSEAFQTPYVLLSTREKVVCGVQKGGFTEATVICSELFPQVVWLASGGLTMLNPAITRQWLWEMPYLCIRIQDAAYFVKVTRRTGPRKGSPYSEKPGTFLQERIDLSPGLQPPFSRLSHPDTV